MTLGPFQEDVPRSVFVGQLWTRVVTRPGPLACAHCHLMFFELFQFRWCHHLFCVTCAARVLEACPLCGAQAVEVDDDAETGDPVEEAAVSRSWTLWTTLALTILGLGLLILLAR